MSPIRFLLILGLLSQPFCGHCLAELRSMSERMETVASSTDILLDSVDDTPVKQTVCTKSPCVKPTKIDMKPLVSDFEIGRFMPPSTTSFSQVGEPVDSCVQQSLPLYLQLSVIRN